MKNKTKLEKTKLSLDIEKILSRNDTMWDPPKSDSFNINSDYISSSNASLSDLEKLRNLMEYQLDTFLKFLEFKGLVN